MYMFSLNNEIIIFCGLIVYYMYNYNRKFLDATINRNDHSINKKTTPNPNNDKP